MNAPQAFPFVIVKQHVLITTDHLLVLATLGLQEIGSRVHVYFVVVYCAAQLVHSPSNSLCVGNIKLRPKSWP